ncbi:MAG: hypothetical protein QXN05_02105 [Acidilobaceae archaeon]
MKRVLALIMLLLLAFMASSISNSLAYAYKLESVVGTIREETVREVCFGLMFAPTYGLPGIEIEVGRTIECGNNTLYESLKLKATLVPGYYVINIGKLYVSAQRPVVITVYIEDGIERSVASLIIASSEWSIELPLASGSTKHLVFDKGVSTVDLTLKIKAMNVGFESFRVGFYSS